MGTNDSCPVDLTGHLSNSSERISMKALGKLYAAAAAKSLQLCPTLQPQRGQPTRLRRPWDSPGKILEWGAVAFSRKVVYLSTNISNC